MMQSFDDNGTPTHAAQSSQVAEAATTTAPVVPQEGATQAALQAPATVEGATPIDHRAELVAVMREQDMDNLAARVVASGGVEGVTFDPVGQMTAEQFTTHAQGVQADLQSAADAHVKGAGIEPEAFYAWVRSRGPQVLNATALTMYHSRDAAMALDPLIAEFRRSPAGRQR